MRFELGEIKIPKEIKEADALFVSHSGGKDSQALLAVLVRYGLKDKIVIIHSDLGDMEWEEMHHWIEQNSFGIPVNVTRADENFDEMVRRLNRIPSNKHQFCTDNLKIKPIDEWIHNYMNKHGMKVGVNVTGIRGEESEKRAKKPIFDISEMNHPKLFPKHKVYDWNPLKLWKVQNVLAEIENAGQKPHKVYSMGFTRLSCVFCINSKVGEHKMAARLKPEIAKRMAKMERDLGKSVRGGTNKKTGKFVHDWIDEKFKITEEKNKDLSSLTHDRVEWKYDAKTDIAEIDFGQHIIQVLKVDGRPVVRLLKDPFKKMTKKNKAKGEQWIVTDEVMDNLQDAFKYGEKLYFRLVDTNLEHLLVVPKKKKKCGDDEGGECDF